MFALHIYRGLPGSGKSTAAKELVTNSPTPIHHYEADMYFMKDGEYKFDPLYISNAHQWCFDMTANSLLGKSSVVVSNTFTQFWEMERYIDHIHWLYEQWECSKGKACKHVAPMIIIRDMMENYGSVHNVPQSAMDRMAARWVPVSEIRKAIFKKYPHLLTIEYGSGNHMVSE